MTNYGYAQSNLYFNKQYKLYPSAIAVGFSVLENDSGFNIIGTCGDSLNAYRNVVFNSWLDSFGNAITYSLIRDETSELYAGLNGGAIKEGNSFIIPGTKEDTSTLYACIYKCNQLGDTLWVKKYQNDTLPYNFITGLQLKQTADNGFILVGEVQLKGAGSGDTRFLAIKTDSLGNKEWLKHYNHRASDRCESVAVTGDGHYLLGGMTIPSVGGPPGSNALIIKIDSLGNLKWKKEIGGSLNDWDPRLTISKDGNYIAGCAYAANEYRGKPHAQIQIVKLDTAGNIIFDKKYCKPRMRTRVNNIITLDDGSFVAVGSTHTDTNFLYHRGWMMKFDCNGDSIWYREYKKHSGIYILQDLYDLKQTSDGGFIACGSLNDDDQNLFYDIWVVKTDSLGCDTSGCQNVSIAHTVPNDLTLKVYPNPASENVIIDYNVPDSKSSQIQLLNAQGLLVRSIHLKAKKGKQSIAVRDLSGGIYYIVLISDSGKTKSLKITIL
jgi:hypothetical protein